MTVPHEVVDQAFRLTLGRPPAAGKSHQFPSISALWQVLVTSAEFRAIKDTKRPVRWPLRQVFVSRNARILYNPIGKNACTFLKRQMARLEGAPEEGFLLQNIHAATDKLNTGLQLCDYSAEEAQGFLTSSDYLRLALLRDPKERLLSAYVEKLVLGRQVEANIFHTRSVIDPVHRRLGLERSDYDRGITFRDFVGEIVSGPPQRLDPHWIPQSLYLKGFSWTHLFAFEDMEALLRLLESRSGLSLPRQPANRTGSGTGEQITGASDLLPAQLIARPRASLASFFDHDLSEKVESYFSEDYRLLGMARQCAVANGGNDCQRGVP